MARKSASAPAGQFAFTFDAPAIASEPAELAGFEAQISRAVSQMLKEDSRSREILAAEVGELLDEDISAHML
ncbi:hypothetical protein, partial [Enterococcus faecalis]|uniref:hypothetical protein n=1 Tax=Enterococcus faecalis TaxID=1351 RepID=UPI00403F9231